MAKNKIGNGNGIENGKKNAKLIVKVFKQHSRFIDMSYIPNTITILTTKKHPMQPQICINIDGNRYDFMVNGLTPDKMEMTIFLLSGQALTIRGVETNIKPLKDGCQMIETPAKTGGV
jgi:hypothetical protein